MRTAFELEERTWKKDSTMALLEAKAGPPELLSRL
jgi:hypothetical protein